MDYSPIDAAKTIHCPTCMVEAGQECWPRQPEDANWVHTSRSRLRRADAGDFTLVVPDARSTL
ncbi:hypothetical protein SEA_SCOOBYDOOBYDOO_10 [Mycobacterium phage ScoobyDoobyDoo]|nr:hypothetical protein SEA_SCOOBYDOOBYDOO_10 [Mycobacterium phage ScoobyDoobyDoo]